MNAITVQSLSTKALWRRLKELDRIEFWSAADKKEYTIVMTEYRKR